jgi:hypothetical protein
MSTLEQVIEMQNEGMEDREIYTRLQNEGISPKEINDSLNQARIKNAVSPPDSAGASPISAPPHQGMQQSIMPYTNETKMPQIEQETQSPYPTPGTPTAPKLPRPEIYPPQDQQQDYYYPETPQAYPEQDYYAPQGGMDTETISEIAEQVATEKLNEFKAKTGDLVSFKNTIQEKVADIDDRLKRIENSIDKLQQAIIGKIGEFGESNAMIHKDLNNLHGTVSKLMNPLIDNIAELKKISR